ncbi:DUF2071 domain-containing protein [Streptomyces canus]|uniref:DUF2071 domain-containing protein n=1 Tax=Streptomyces canus TaxID=58343 RepID=UPI00074AB12E|nr:hypothetical protein AQI96_33320 [Streptomyces canus]
MPYGAATTWEFPRFPRGDPVVVVAYGAADGVAWVGLTAFVMADVRPAGVPATVPGLPSLAETNLPAPLDEPVGHYSPGVEPVRPGPTRPLFT